jgi:hypothetical protein
MLFTDEASELIQAVESEIPAPQAIDVDSDVNEDFVAEESETEASDFGPAVVPDESAVVDEASSLIESEEGADDALADQSQADDEPSPDQDEALEPLEALKLDVPASRALDADADADVAEDVVDDGAVINYTSSYGGALLDDETDSEALELAEAESEDETSPDADEASELIQVVESEVESEVPAPRAIDVDANVQEDFVAVESETEAFELAAAVAPDESSAVEDEASPLIDSEERADDAIADQSQGEDETSTCIDADEASEVLEAFASEVPAPRAIDVDANVQEDFVAVESETEAFELAVAVAPDESSAVEDEASPLIDSEERADDAIADQSQGEDETSTCTDADEAPEVLEAFASEVPAGSQVKSVSFGGPSAVGPPSSPLTSTPTSGAIQASHGRNALGLGCNAKDGVETKEYHFDAVLDPGSVVAIVLYDVYGKTVRLLPIKKEMHVKVSGERSVCVNVPQTWGGSPQAMFLGPKTAFFAYPIGRSGVLVGSRTSSVHRQTIFGSESFSSGEHPNLRLHCIRKETDVLTAALDKKGMKKYTDVGPSVRMQTNLLDRSTFKESARACLIRMKNAKDADPDTETDTETDAASIESLLFAPNTHLDVQVVVDPNKLVVFQHGHDDLSVGALIERMRGDDSENGGLAALVVRYPPELGSTRNRAPETKRTYFAIVLVPAVFATALLVDPQLIYCAGKPIQPKTTEWNTGKSHFFCVTNSSSPEDIEDFEKVYPLDVQYRWTDPDTGVSVLIFPNIEQCSFTISTGTAEDSMKKVDSGEIKVEEGNLCSSKLTGLLFGRSRNGYFKDTIFHNVELGVFIDYSGQGKKGIVRLYLPEEDERHSSFWYTVTNASKVLTTCSSHFLPVLHGETTVTFRRGDVFSKMTLHVDYSFE